MAYEININIKGKVSKQSAVAGQNAKLETSLDDRQTAIGTFVATQTIEPFIKQTASYFLNNIQARTGSRELQERVNFAMQTVETARGIISTTSAGASLGGGAGAAIGAIVGVLQAGMNVLFNQLTIDNSIKVEKERTAILKERFGVQYNKSRER